MKEYEAIRYTAQGSEDLITIKAFKQLQEIVDGYIEVVPKGQGFSFIVNEEGMLKNLPVNPIVPRFVGTVILIKDTYLKEMPYE